MLQNARWRWSIDVTTRLENWLENERDQLALWVPVALGLGVSLWFWIPERTGWIALLLLSDACGCRRRSVGTIAAVGQGVGSPSRGR